MDDRWNKGFHYYTRGGCIFPPNMIMTNFVYMSLWSLLYLIKCFTILQLFLTHW